MNFFSDIKALFRSRDSGKQTRGDPIDPQALEVHLLETISWLLNSIRFSKNDGGSAQSYRLFRGWNTSFPETSGYIIPTLLDYSKSGRAKHEEAKVAAVDLGRWLMLIQMRNGACMSGLYNSDPTPSVFNTGQNLLGYQRLYEEDQGDEFLQAARRSAEFIVSCQDGSGAYVRYAFNDLMACYNVRVAWATLKFGLATKVERYIQSGMRNIEWTLANQRDNGWFSNNTFSASKNSNTHSIAYVLEGLIESYALVHEKRLLDAVISTAEGMLSRYRARGWISGEHNGNFDYLKSYKCVTGNIQLAGVWLKLATILADARYLHGAIDLISWYLKFHDITSVNPGIRGGVHGSLPHWGRYAPLKYPNWAAKFLCDVLMNLLLLLRNPNFGSGVESIPREA